MSAKVQKRSQAVHPKTPTTDISVAAPWLAFWFLVVVSSGGFSLLLAQHYTWASHNTVVPVAGESVLQAGTGSPSIVGTPSISYATRGGSSYLTTNLQVSKTASEIDLVISDIVVDVPCLINGGAFVGKAEFLRRLTVPVKVGEKHEASAYRVRVIPNRGKLVTVTCDIADTPGEDSYATRNVQYVPIAVSIQGFRQAWPQRVSFDIEGTIDIAVTGDVAPGPIAHFLEEREVGLDNLTLRARWTSIQAQSRRDFGLFFAAVVAGISGSALVELVRRTFELLLLRREHAAKKVI